MGDRPGSSPGDRTIKSLWLVGMLTGGFLIFHGRFIAKIKAFRGIFSLSAAYFSHWQTCRLFGLDYFSRGQDLNPCRQGLEQPT